MLEYRSLQNTSLEVVHAAFLHAFSDYQVPINLTVSQFTTMLYRRGYSGELSVGAFQGDKLVGFILNGCRLWDGVKTLYDCGTGVIPGFRQQGITTNLFSNLQVVLRNNAIQQYLLEVIQTNLPAIELYNKLGFSIERSFSCYRCVQFRQSKACEQLQYSVQNVAATDWDTVTLFWDVKPSWQNSIASVLAVSDSMLLVTAEKDGITVGYGIFDQHTGDIAQFAVSKSYRRQGIGSALVAEIQQLSESPKSSITNVDSTCLGVNKFFERLGFQNYVQQYEMALNT